MEDRQELVTTERTRVPGGLHRWQVSDGVIPLYLGIGRGEVLDELPGSRLIRAVFEDHHIRTTKIRGIRHLLRHGSNGPFAIHRRATLLLDEPDSQGATEEHWRRSLIKPIYFSKVGCLILRRKTLL